MRRMITEIVMPRLSDTMTDGVVSKWHKAVGDEVSKGEPLVDIESDKALVTYESDTAGVLVEILAEEDATVDVGQTIAWIDTRS